MRFLRYLPRFRQAYRALGRLAQRETWPRGDIEGFQLERLNRLWTQALAGVPHYRELGARRLVPPSFGSLDEFRDTAPLLTKEELRSRPERFLSERRGDGAWKLTGGSTGQPTRVFWGTAAHREMLHAKYRLYHAWGIDILDPTVFLWGHGASFVPGLKGRVARVRQPAMDWLRNRRRLSAYKLGAGDLQNHLRQLAAFRPAALYGYSSAVWLLAREALATEFACDGLRLVVVTSEPVYPHMTATIARAFGAPVIQEYGSIECGHIAGQWRDGTLRVREDMVLLETLPRQDGRYDIAVTVLNNPLFPLVRFLIGDVTDAPLARPTQGFSILDGVSGRGNELILTRTGHCVHPFWFDDVFENTPGARRWQIHQHADGAISVSLELTDPSIVVDTAALERRIGQQVEGWPVEVRIVDAIPQTVGGKHRWVVSEAARVQPRRTDARAIDNPSPHHVSCNLSERVP